MEQQALDWWGSNSLEEYINCLKQCNLNSYDPLDVKTEDILKMYRYKLIMECLG